eukprot:15359637-Ditylum_brightwellii.AAC.1
MGDQLDCQEKQNAKVSTDDDLYLGIVVGFNHAGAAGCLKKMPCHLCTICQKWTEELAPCKATIFD